MIRRLLGFGHLLQLRLCLEIDLCFRYTMAVPWRVLDVVVRVASLLDRHALELFMNNDEKENRMYGCVRAVGAEVYDQLPWIPLTDRRIHANWHSPIRNVVQQSDVQTSYPRCNLYFWRSEGDDVHDNNGRVTAVHNENITLRTRRSDCVAN